MIRRTISLALIVYSAPLFAQGVSSASGGPVPSALGTQEVTERGLERALDSAAAGSLPPGAQRAGAWGKTGGSGARTSSSQDRAPGQTDTFDLGRGRGGGRSMKGAEDGPVFLESPANSAPAQERESRKTSVVVQKGDSLWTICDRELGNAYAWPKVWALNPHVENPHVIEPGQAIRLTAEGSLAGGAASGGRGPGRFGSSQGGGKASGFNFRPGSRVDPQSIFQLDEGLVEDDDGAIAGEIQGSPSDRLYLAAGDDVWIKPADGKKLEVGQVLIVQRPVEKTTVGTVVHHVGSLRVTAMREGYTLVRGVIVEASDVIERGMKLSSEARELRIVAPVAGAPDLVARIVGATHLHAFYGQNQVVFLDRGSNDKLESGHTLFVDREGDGLANTSTYREARTTLSLDAEGLGEEHANGTPSTEALPSDRIAELRVVAVKPHSATCLVLRARREIEKSDVARTSSVP